eukprot:CAMPEP_0203671790 /NCGR_PEP_ID=MMETSP0090-20130426/7477_1 /ASSEMBLY_ACC=CAM_ASM_001088 /TAXON_ID=426623 /ORGANISM="Chaetoceros affinis, Strain CCMP159" /LENGTH=376 /DNA_ID=CAMNT_0050536935 /DNA_START=34 /DNA_END=1164 /DNA_ORIENTATION=+
MASITTAAIHATAASKRFLLRRQCLSSRSTARALKFLSKSAAVSSSTLSSLSFSTAAERPDPSQYVQGVTASDLENSPALKDFFAANFPEAFGKSQGDNDEENEDVFEIDGVLMKIGRPSSSQQQQRQQQQQSENQYMDIDITEQSCDLSLNIRPMVSYKRCIETEEGSRQCRRLRHNDDMIPGMLWGSDPTQGILSNDTSPSTRIMIKTPSRYIQREMDLFTYHNFGSRVYDLTIFEEEGDTEGTVHRVTPRDVQHHPVQFGKLYCLNFVRYYPGKPIDIPITYINEEESPAMKRGGFIAPFNRYVSCIVEEGVSIPEKIELDCTGTLLKDVLRRDRLIFPEGVRPSHKAKEDFLIGTVFGRRVDLAVAATEEGE